MNPEHAEIIALQALTHIVCNQNLCRIFFEKTGLDEVALRERISDTDHLAGILDYICKNSLENYAVTTFCKESDIQPDLVLQAWQALTKPLPDI